MRRSEKKKPPCDDMAACEMASLKWLYVNSGEDLHGVVFSQLLNNYMRQRCERQAD
jgi:hypothetical protein